MATPMKYTMEGVPKNWDGKDWQTYKWAMKMVFKEQGLTPIVECELTKAMLTAQQSEEEFDMKQTKIMRMIGTSVPPDILLQVRDAETGSDMWDKLCGLYENKVNKTVRVHTIRRLVNEIWSMKLAVGGDSNLHLCKMFNLRTELINLQYTLEDTDMVEMLLESLPEQAEFETLKSSVRYNADTSVYTPTKVRELIRAAASRQSELRSKQGGGHNGSHNGNHKGGEFINTNMANWYPSKGIEHDKVGPKSSQLILCERVHQSLVEMMKAMMHQAGFSRSLWPEALRNAVYVKNRVYNRATQAIPYEQMFGIKPDIHHIRTFGALAYVHVPVAPGRHKHQDNAKLGFWVMLKT